MKSNRIGPNLYLSGRDIHKAFRRIRPLQTRRWSKVPSSVKALYEAMARELNRELDARQAWFEGEEDTVTIMAVRCNACGEMLQVVHAEGHACWLEVTK